MVQTDGDALKWVKEGKETLEHTFVYVMPSSALILYL